MKKPRLQEPWFFAAVRFSHASIRSAAQAFFEEAGEDYQRHNSEDYLSKGLGISQTVEREELVEKPQRGYLEHNFAQNGKYKRVSSHTDGLEHTDGEKVNAHEGSGYAHAAQEARAIATIISLSINRLMKKGQMKYSAETIVIIMTEATPAKRMASFMRLLFPEE